VLRLLKFRQGWHLFSVSLLVHGADGEGAKVTPVNGGTEGGKRRAEREGLRDCAAVHWDLLASFCARCCRLQTSGVIRIVYALHTGTNFGDYSASVVN